MLEDIANRALRLLPRGVTHGEARYVSHHTLTIRVRDGRLVSYQSDTSAGVGVRVLSGSGWGFASTVSLDDASLRWTGVRAAALAGADGLLNRETVPPPPDPAQQGRWSCLPSPTEPPLERWIALLFKADSEMARVPRISRREGEILCCETLEEVATTAGTRLSQRYRTTGGWIRAMAQDGIRRQVRTYPGLGAPQRMGGPELIGDLKLVERAGSLAEEAVALMTAPPCPEEKHDLVLSSQLMALQVHETLGHLLEPDPDDPTISLVMPQDVGQLRLASEAVSLRDDGTTPGGLGTRAFDDKGHRMQAVEIIRQGVLVGLPGAMRASDHEGLAMARMTNLNLVPGQGRLADLLAQAENGLFLDGYRGLGISRDRQSFWIQAEVGRRIQGGALAGLVQGPVYHGSTIDLWKACHSLAGPEEGVLWGIPWCTRGNPPQRVGTGHLAFPGLFRQVDTGDRKEH